MISKINEKENDRNIIILIAFFKILKSILLFGVALFLLFDNENNHEKIKKYFEIHNLLTNNFVKLLLLKINTINQYKTLIEFSSFIYGCIFFTEAIGLYFKKVWAEYFTIIVTLSFIPFEIYELIKNFTFIKLTVILINFLVVTYLYARIKNKNEGLRKNN